MRRQTLLRTFRATVGGMVVASGVLALVAVLTPAPPSLVQADVVLPWDEESVARTVTELADALSPQAFYARAFPRQRLEDAGTGNRPMAPVVLQDDGDPDDEDGRTDRPAQRERWLREFGGNVRSEAAVAWGLKWLAAHQADNGSWNLHDCAKAGKCNCTGDGADNPVLGTALVMLPYLGAGQNHRNRWKGDLYSRKIDRALKHLLTHQRADGGGFGNLYTHGLATLALCESYGQTGDPLLKGPALRAVRYLAAAQHDAGGWRYQPRTPGDTSVTGWQVEALAAARRARLDLPAGVLENAGLFLESVRATDGGYGYQGPKTTPAMTAVALLCRRHTGWPRVSKEFKPERVGALVAQLDDPRFAVRQQADETLRDLGPKTIPLLREALNAKPALEVATRLERIIGHLTSAVAWSVAQPDVARGVALLQRHPPTAQKKDIYYYFHATDLMFLVGGAAWEGWNARVRDLLIERQDRGTDAARRHHKGSWDPAGDAWERQLGRPGVTALAVLTLEVYYRRAGDLPVRQVGTPQEFPRER